MANIVAINNLSSPELAVYTRLKDPPHRAGWEAENGVFIAENPKVIAVALEAGYEPLSLLTERRHITGSAREIIERCGGIPVYTGEREVLAALTGYELTRGVLCAMRRKPPRDAAEICEGAQLVAVLENITDVTNLGAIFRSAAALGVDAVLLSPSCCDPLSRRSIRVSMGAVFLVPWARLGLGAADWPVRGMETLRSLGFATAALALREDSIPLDDPRLRACGRLALLLGTEGDGLADMTIARCDYTVRIPMYNRVDSLNVAAAGAVAFWELRRR